MVWHKEDNTINLINSMFNFIHTRPVDLMFIRYVTWNINLEIEFVKKACKR